MFLRVFKLLEEEYSYAERISEVEIEPISLATRKKGPQRQKERISKESFATNLRFERMAKTGIHLVHACYICNAAYFEEKKRLRRHLQNIHGIHVSPGIKGSKPRPKANHSFVDQQDASTITMYSCPSCTDYFESLDLLKFHVNTIHEREDCLDKEELGPEIDLASDNTMSGISPTINPCAIVNHSVSSIGAVASVSGYDADSAAIYACQQMDADDTEKSKTLYILDTLALQPFAIIDKHGHAKHALAHKKIISDLVGKHDSIRSILPMKRRHLDTTHHLCINCSPVIATGLENLFAVSPYIDILQQRTFVELTPNICALVNKDWDFYPQIKYATAKLFSGCIL
ncbi:hypothetical protein CLU79DRAFT_882030, partial [Phycomyces nitens]